MPVDTPAKLFLPGQERVVDLDGPRADDHRSDDALWRDARIDVPQLAVEALRRSVGIAHGDSDPVEAACFGLCLGGLGQLGGDAEAAVGFTHGDVLKFGRIAERQVGVSERLLAVPSHQVEAIAAEARKPQYGASPALERQRRVRYPNA